MYQITTANHKKKLLRCVTQNHKCQLVMGLQEKLPSNSENVSTNSEQGRLCLVKKTNDRHAFICINGDKPNVTSCGSRVWELVLCQYVYACFGNC